MSAPNIHHLLRHLLYDALRISLSESTADQRRAGWDAWLRAGEPLVEEEKPTHEPCVLASSYFAVTGAWARRVEELEKKLAAAQPEAKPTPGFWACGAHDYPHIEKGKTCSVCYSLWRLTGPTGESHFTVDAAIGSTAGWNAALEVGAIEAKAVGREWEEAAGFESVRDALVEQIIARIKARKRP